MLTVKIFPNISGPKSELLRTLELYKHVNYSNQVFANLVQTGKIVKLYHGNYKLINCTSFDVHVSTNNIREYYHVKIKSYGHL